MTADSFPAKYRNAPAIRTLLEARGRHAVTIGCSAADVFRVVVGNDARFIKIKPDDGFEPLAYERDVLTWLAPRVPVPAVLDYGHDAGFEYLVTSALPGLDGVALHESGRVAPQALVALLADGLRQLHAVPIADCPFDQRLTRKLQQARANIDAGRVDETDFDLERREMSAMAVFRRLRAQPPAETVLVFNHGDYCLPNIIFHEGRLAGYIDLGRAGVADRYNDLAIASRSIAYNLGAAYAQAFFERYGLDRPDRERLAYYRALDELF